MVWGHQNPPFLSRSREARLWGAIVGAYYLGSTIKTVWIGPMT